MEQGLHLDHCCIDCIAGNHCEFHGIVAFQESFTQEVLCKEQESMWAVLHECFICDRESARAAIHERFICKMLYFNQFRKVFTRESL